MLAMLAWSGLRAKEIPLATWSMVLDADGNVGDTLELHDKASKAPWHRRPWIVLVPFSHYRDGEVTGVELIAKYVSDDLAWIVEVADLRLVHRRLRHAGPYRRQGAAGAGPVMSEVGKWLEAINMLTPSRPMKSIWT
jgi:hypothetical protein